MKSKPLVLLTEEHRFLALVTARQLDTLGFEVIVTHSARDALSRLTEIAPHAIISDIALPDMCGFAFAGQVRELTHKTSCRLIAYCSSCDSQDRRNALAAGYDDFLIKPAEPWELRQAITPDAIVAPSRTRQTSPAA